MKKTVLLVVFFAQAQGLAADPVAVPVAGAPPAAVPPVWYPDAPPDKAAPAAPAPPPIAVGETVIIEGAPTTVVLVDGIWGYYDPGKTFRRLPATGVTRFVSPTAKGTSPRANPH